MRDVVSNTSPLLYLHQLGRLDVLQALYPRVLVPQSVVAEVDVERARGYDVPTVGEASWIEMVSSPTLSLLALATERCEPGDSATGSPDLEGSGEAQGRIRDDLDSPRNPREGAARALADGVVAALRAGDFVAAQACTEALRTLVAELGKGLSPGGHEARPALEDLELARRRRRTDSD